MVQRGGGLDGPLPCMALYCRGVTCPKPGGGTSQYRHALFFLLLFGEWLEGQLRWAVCPRRGHPVPTHLRFLWSRDELRRSRLLRSRLRLLFSRLRRFSPRQAGDPLRLLLLFLSLSRSVQTQYGTIIIQPMNLPLNSPDPSICITFSPNGHRNDKNNHQNWS